VVNHSPLADRSLRERVQRALAAFAVQRAAVGAERRAAVAVVLLEEGEGADIDGLAKPQGWSRAAALLLT
ncbi:hypothetical protein HJU46_18180, partial [Clostridium butyricum]|nr:hypothetical protein [Clostridium butyricum]